MINPDALKLVPTSKISHPKVSGREPDPYFDDALLTSIMIL